MLAAILILADSNIIDLTVSELAESIISGDAMQGFMLNQS